MIATANELFTELQLENGLRVILHEDHTTPIVTINVLYHVGSKNEQLGRTGFAHLFEHLMFEGSRNIPRGAYDTWCTSVGGDNNAFTSSDVTSYYISLPSSHLALGLWLESDRMAEFAIEETSLRTQQSVIAEEKRQTIDETPYGSAQVVLHEISFRAPHPYSWDTIGSMEDVAAATMHDVREFYQRFYVPANAVLVVAGDFNPDDALPLVEGYFSTIPSGIHAQLPEADPALRCYGGYRLLNDRAIAHHAAFLAWHVPSLRHADNPACDLLTGILGDGESCRLFRTLEYEMEIASETGCYLDEGELGSLMVAYAVAQSNRIPPGSLTQALIAAVRDIAENGVTERELEKARNRKMTSITHSLQSVSNRAERLAMCAALLNDPALAFAEAELYDSVTADDIQRVAREYLCNAQPNVVEYRAVR
ncbi:MAG: insulinase family protein [Chlorobi bacterium]|nr:insulinase family protein [Chlorobiota bacterium]